MSVQILEANGKPAFAVIPYAEYQALLDLAEDAEDAARLTRFARRYPRGEVETVPVAVVDRLLAGESRLRVWREHRDMTAAKLAATVGITPAHVSKLEAGKGEPSVALLRRLAKALGVQLDDLA
jgi:DNA-binding XRE family transcriptional regulator